MSECQVNSSGTMPVTDDEALPQSMAACMDKFARTFEASARRWELVIYPSMLAFIVLAAYGFFLIYTLTTDVGRLARSMETVTVAMTDVSANMTAVSGNVAQISGNLSLIAYDMGDGTDSIRNMLVKMDTMNTNIGVMTVPVYEMRNDMGHLSKNISDVSSPMKMIPW